VCCNSVISARSYITVAGKAFRPADVKLGALAYFRSRLAIIHLVVVVVLPTLALIVAAFASFCSSAASRAHRSEAVFADPLRAVVDNSARAASIVIHGGRFHHGGDRWRIGVCDRYTVNRTNLRGTWRHQCDLHHSGRDPPVSSSVLRICGRGSGCRRSLRHHLDSGARLHRTLHADTIKALSTSMLQIHKELEEASWICGKGLVGTIRLIVLPARAAGRDRAMTLLFVLAIRELGSSLFLYTSDTMVMRAAARLLEAAMSASRRRSAWCRPCCSPC